VIFVYLILLAVLWSWLRLSI